jgi:hypothetical protein
MKPSGSDIAAIEGDDIPDDDRPLRVILYGRQFAMLDDPAFACFTASGPNCLQTGRAPRGRRREKGRGVFLRTTQPPLCLPRPYEQTCRSHFSQNFWSADFPDFLGRFNRSRGCAI